jgi:uncharacterized protein YdgA (DUF945 family)
MIKKIIIGVLALITLAAILAGLPYFAGLRTEKYFLETMNAYSEYPYINFRVTDYKRGWFTSYAESAMEINIMNEKIPVAFKHEIEHGPSLSNIGLAKVITRISFSEKTESELNYYFKERAPIEMTTYIGMLGGQEIELTIPSFDGHPNGKDNVNINWKGLDGKIDVASDMSRYAGKIKAPLLAISEQKGGAARIDNIVMDMDMKQRAEGLWLGNTSVNIDSIEFYIDKKKPDSEIEKINIKGISFDQTSSEEDGLISQAVIGRADSITAVDRTFKEGVFDAEIRNVSMEAFLNLQHKMKVIAENNLPEDEARKRIFEAMKDLLPEFLSHSPEYIINRVAFSSDKGDIHANARVKYVGNGDYKAFDPVNDLACDAMLSVPKEFLREIALTFTRKQISNQLKPAGTNMTEEDFEKLCQQAVDKNIEVLLQNNFIVEDGDTYTSRFALGDAGMTLNGKSLNIPLKR